MSRRRKDGCWYMTKYEKNRPPLFFIPFLTKENKIIFLKGGEGRRGKQGKIILPFPIFTGQINIKSPTSDRECRVKMISSVLSSCPISRRKCQQEVLCRGYF
jgi:hypothetical protein